MLGTLEKYVSPMHENMLVISLDHWGFFCLFFNMQNELYRLKIILLKTSLLGNSDSNESSLSYPLVSSRPNMWALRLPLNSQFHLSNVTNVPPYLDFCVGIHVIFTQ